MAYDEALTQKKVRWETSNAEHDILQIYVIDLRSRRAEETGHQRIENETPRSAAVARELYFA